MPAGGKSGGNAGGTGSGGNNSGTEGSGRGTSRDGNGNGNSNSLGYRNRDREARIKKKKEEAAALAARYTKHQVEGTGMVSYNPSTDVATAAYKGEISNLLEEFGDSRKNEVDIAYQKKLDERGKIKTISDPDGNKAAGKRKAAKRKQQGRTGTLLSEGKQTLG
ncbi:MAG TPA: hypothetical protein VMW64_03405 [Dehalococcoidia bacterium]|nr:hypothetical protein [Dehalococcoidia bacterium]